MSEEMANQFEIKTVQPALADETTVTGKVLSGTIRKGSWIAFTSSDDTPVTGQICRIGTVGAPLNVIREGEETTLLIGVEERYLSPGMVVSTSEEGTYAPTMILTEMAPAQRGDMQVRSQELVDIELLINQRSYREALEALDKYHPGQNTAYIPLQLKARIHLESEPTDEEHDTKEALRLIREAYDGKGKADGDVLETLARALGENGEPVSGLRYLDRLYNYALDVESREYYQSKIMAHRRRYKIGDKWEVLDATGDVVFSTGTEAEIAEGYEEDRFPEGAQVRKNRVGELIDIKPFVSGIGLPKKKKGGDGAAAGSVNIAVAGAIGLVIGLAVGTAAGLSTPLCGGIGVLVGLALGAANERFGGSKKK